MPDELFLVAARALAGCVSDGRLSAGAPYPTISELRPVTRAIATAVARRAAEIGLSPLGYPTAAEAAVDAAMWWPAYVPYEATEERRSRTT